VGQRTIPASPSRDDPYIPIRWGSAKKTRITLEAITSATAIGDIAKKVNLSLRDSGGEWDPHQAKEVKRIRAFDA